MVQVTARAENASASVTVSVFVAGVPGTLDTRFGDSGVVRLRPYAGSQETTVLLAQGSSSILVSPGPLIERFNGSGELDTAFGAGGKVQIDLSSIGFTTCRTAFATWDHTGRLVVAGDGATGADSDGYIFRLTKDGQVDPTLTPRRIEAVPGDQQVTSVAAAADGTILVTGETYSATTEPFAWRISPDSSARRIPFSGRHQHGNRPYMQVNGLAWSYGDATNTVVRVFDDGRHDPSFGTAGKTTLPLGETLGGGWSMGVPAKNGRVMLAGLNNSGNLRIWRLLTTGVVDAGVRCRRSGREGLRRLQRTTTRLSRR
jgi:uncharacterized delta-60 repeat protein